MTPEDSQVPELKPTKAQILEYLERCFIVQSKLDGTVFKELSELQRAALHAVEETFCDCYGCKTQRHKCEKELTTRAPDTALQQVAERMAEALEHYADNKQWSEDGRIWKREGSNCKGPICPQFMPGLDKGSTAKQALAAYEKLQEGK